MAIRSTDRVLVLRKIDPKGDTGLIDPAVFEGKNNLHILMDEQTSLWGFKYEKGIVPPVLKNKFTKFGLAYAEALKYLKSKNVEVVEVRDQTTN